MNIKIAGQSSKSNYRNTGSCGGAVIYNEHELRDLPQLFQELEVKPEDLAWFDMDGHVVTGAEVMDKIGRLTGHLGKNDAKFYCTMINPSDDEALAMGATVDEQITNGRPFVFDVMDAYAENFHREGVKDRHDLVAFAIPHVFKSEGKQQIHWHVIQARKDATNKYKLSPLTNHKNTTKGAVHGGFDRVAFDAECEKRFDIRYNYERRVEHSFDYLLAEKKGSVEEKAVQETRLALQNLPELKESIQAAITRRVERLAREAAERANKERQAQEKAARAAEKAAQEAIRQEQRDVIADFSSTIVPFGKQIYGIRNNTYELCKEAMESEIGLSAATASVFKKLKETWKENDKFNQQIAESKTRTDTFEAVCGILTCLNPIVGLTAMLLAGIAGDIHRASLAAQKKKLLLKVNSLRDELTALEAKKATLTIDKLVRLNQYLNANRMYKEYRDSLQTVDREVVAIESDIRVAEKTTTPAVKPIPSVTPVAQQQAAPTPPPAAKTYEIVLEFKCNYKYRIKKEQDGLMKLQKLDWDKKSPIVDGKHTGRLWYTKEKFTSYKEVGHDNDGVYFKIKDTDGKTRYINQNGIDISQKKKQQLGISGPISGGMKRS